MREKKTPRNNKNFYILDLSKLKIGDIILESGNSLCSQTIKLATNSKYSHAKFYWEYGSCIEALFDGVHSYNIKRVLYEHPNDVKVLRYKKDITPYINNIISNIRSKIGAPYSISLAMKTKVPFITDDKRKEFCSKLIALSFEDAGVSLVRDAERCTPASLEKSPELISINNCTCLATREEIEFAKSESFLDVQKKSTNFLISECSKLANVKFFNLNDICNFLIKNKEFDQSFSTILRKSGYLTLIENFEIPKNKYRYDDNELEELLKFKTIDFTFEYKLQKMAYKRHKEVYITTQMNAKKLNLEYFTLINNLYYRLVKVHYESAIRFLKRIRYSKKIADKK